MQGRLAGAPAMIVLALIVAAFLVAYGLRDGNLDVVVESGVEGDVEDENAELALEPDAASNCTLIAPIREESLEDIEDGVQEQVHNSVIADSPGAAIAEWATSVRGRRGPGAGNSPVDIAAERSSRARAIPWEALPAEAREALEQHPFRDRFEVWSTATDLDHPEIGDASYLFVDEGSKSKLLSLEIAVSCDEEDVFPE